MVTRIIVNIPHEELPKPPLRALVDLREVDFRQRLVVKAKSASLVMKGGGKPLTKLNRDEMLELLGG